MVENISNKVLNSERSLSRRDHTNDVQRSNFQPIRVFSTYGSDDELVQTTKKYEEHLSRTRSFSETDTGSQHDIPPLPPEVTKTRRLFQYTKKTGASLRSRLVKLKQLALGGQYGPTRKCRKGKCMCCTLVSEDHQFRVNGKTAKSDPGNCKSYNIIYLVQCSICQKGYVGRTTHFLHVRMREHRNKYYDLLRGKKVDDQSDEYSLGLHLASHGFTDRKNFNECYNVSIIDNASPRTIEVKENKFIQVLKTLRPLGINTVNPFGLPLLHT